MNQWIIILPLFLGLLFVNFDVEHYYPSVSRNLHPISKIGNIGNIRNYPLNYNTGKKNTFPGEKVICLVEEVPTGCYDVVQLENQ